MKKILVTGAGGLVGYDVAKALMKNSEYQVFATVHNQRINDLQNIIQIDLQKTSIENLEIDFNCIVHCAARIPDSICNDEQAAYMNRCIDDNVISYCANHKCKLIYISGISVYGNDRKEFLTEQMEVNIENISSKYISEKRNSEIKIENKCDSYCILRVSSPYGPQQRNNNVLKIFMTAACGGEDIYYFGTGERTQNFIDVRDIAQAVLKSIEYPQNEIFNIASNSSISMKKLANLVLEVGKEEFHTTSEVCAGNSVDSQENVRINIDISLAEKLIGWKPQIVLEDGIRYWMKNIKKGM